MCNKKLLKQAGVLTVAALIAAALYYAPFALFSAQPKPEQPPPKPYDYYIVVEEDTKEILMYVPLVVHVGDELISDQNKRYRIVRVEENQAYARFVETVNIPTP